MKYLILRKDYYYSVYKNRFQLYTIEKDYKITVCHYRLGHKCLKLKWFPIYIVKLTKCTNAKID